MAFGISFILRWLIVAQFVVVSPGKKSEDFAPRFVEQPKSLIVKRGDPAQFECRAEGKPPPTIRWFKDGRPLRIGGRRSILDASGTLFFLEVIGSRQGGQDGGLYQCEASNSLGTVFSNNATLEIAFSYQPWLMRELLLGQTPENGKSIPSLEASLATPVVSLESQVSSTLSSLSLPTILRISSHLPPPPDHITDLKTDFKLEPESDQLISGDSAVLVCTPPRGYPNPEVTWLKNDELIEPDNIRVKIMADGNLMLKELRKDDEGVYKCRATNVAGEATSRAATLTVQVKPSFINPPQDTITAPGEAAVLRCEVEGDPEPTVTWSRDIGEIPAGRTTQLPDNSLRIRHTEEQDDGYYICTAVNIWGTSDARARLRVSAVPDFVRAPRDKVIRVDQTARFQCEAVGSPAPIIHWQKEGTEENLLFIKQQRGRFRVSASGELQISSVRMEDAGTYVCYASGGTGVAEASAVLRVIGGTGAGGEADESMAPPPILRYGPANQTLVVGSVATFLCRSAGNPTPTIDWTKDGNTISYSSSRISQQPDGTLQITGVESGDSGLYTCIATNSSGETSRSATLLVIDEETAEHPVVTAPSTNELPNAPSQPSLVNATQSSIQLRWSPPIANRSPPVIGYQVEYYRLEQTNGAGWTVAATNIQGEGVTLNHLIPATSYMVVVRAINSNGLGLPSPISETFSTQDDRVTEECQSDVLSSTTVEITAITALSPSAIKVTWQATQNEDQISSYQVRYRLSSGAEGALVQSVEGMTSTIITGLDAGTDYTVSVRPQVCRRAGPESPAMAARTLEEGEGPLCRPGDSRYMQNKLDGSAIAISSAVALGPNAIQVRWEIRQHATQYVEGLHIKYRQIGAAPAAYFIETITNPESTFALNGLSAWTEYAISVQPFNGLYCGILSEETIARTGADIPRAPPQSVVARSNGSSAIIVSWRAPPKERVHGYIAGYHVSCRGNRTSQQRNRTIQGNTTFSSRISGLEAGKVYRVLVSAYTTAGMGPSSSVVVVALPATLVAVVPGSGDGIDTTNRGGVTDEPWFYGIIAGFVMMILLVLVAFVLRRRKLKHAANLTKNPLGLEGATHMTSLTSQYDGQPTSNGHPSWPPDQTWRSNNSSECQSSSLHGNGSAAAVTTFAPPPNGSLRSVLGKNQYLQPHHSGATSPAYWLLEAYESKDHLQMTQGEKQDMSTCKSDQYNRNNVPVYAVVDNESEDDDESPSCPHMAHTLPLNQCTHMLPEHCQSLPPHMAEPYASTTLVLPPNIREYMAAQRQNCSDTSSGSASGSITYPLPSSAGQLKGRKKSGKKGRQGDMDGVPPLPPQRDGSHLCADCQSGLSDSGTSSQGSRRKPKVRPGVGGKYPSSNWTEFLPPPPEEPPMGADPSTMQLQDSISKPKPLPPCNGHPTFVPIQPALMSSGGHPPTHQHAPALPMRQHPQQLSYPYTAPFTHPHTVQSNGLPHTLPVVSRGDDQLLGQHPMGVATTLPQRGLMNGQYPPMSGVQGVQPLAPHQVFEDPRHEQLGRELLEFNDDLMSQSEAMSDNEEAQPMLPRIGGNTGLQDQSPKLIPDDLETDLETSSNCTGSMLASWASMNGSSTGEAIATAPPAAARMGRSAPRRTLPVP
ncbi:roundabout homolog 2-like [Diadema antillarum]|uniref:roundabout homolog 2-like n=1 Tax=Diadema antillarum TaxID=105358 RepID=UPI003A8A7F3C